MPGYIAYNGNDWEKGLFGYIIKRLILVIPTLLGILTLNFFIIQAVPGGPVEQAIAKLQGYGQEGRLTGSQGDFMPVQQPKSGHGYEVSRSIDPAIIESIRKSYGFDKPIGERYIEMLKQYAVFDLGDSFYKNDSVLNLVFQKLPVSASLGIWSTLLMYLIAIPLGVLKSVRHGSRFDVISSTVIIIGNAIPTFLLAIMLLILFAGGNYFDWFPMRGLFVDHFDQLSFGQKIISYFWHLALPLLSIIVSSIAGMTLLTKNSFLEEINKQYVNLARAKGLNEKKVLFGHVFRNAMLVIISSFPAAFVGMFFTGSLLVEIIFSLDGLGLLGYQATIQRDYPVVFGTLYLFTLLGLVVNLISDLCYTWVDKRIHFGESG